ncbi:hypothetical protein BDN70DRAFT_899429 [Pholiota conissans]|uniref:HSF-type DNA-binding domain-containing protein n=1 Tax=Pholiota conissans TaxID=109636 RepID=A0A9P5YU63_9AGAR|nr:hypothetical protein BDN70DRAFT_899429 [Pholiota conissans]
MPTPSTHISKAARQVVPAFLQKLYEMVNDPNNAELIRWSDAGDSFFVLDHERFAHEVLGRWFKHRNFSSFVRQLNMYGFHKIPHLQQGVLKSDTDTEFWNFAHANFHRGQPDLLCLIQRKKQVPQPGEEGALDFRDSTSGLALPAPATSNVNPTNPTLASGQILDVNSIVNGIAAIKRHQTTISTELNELKRSNQLLWQDALAARAKHQKQQDTINRILKFLAGVFGQQASGNGPVAGASPNVSGGQQKEGGLGDTMSSGTRRKMRLMIEDAKRDGPKKSMVEELSEIPMETDFETSYPTIETPSSVASPSPSISVSEGVTVGDALAYYPISESNSSKTDTSPTPTQQQQGKEISRAVTPARSPSFEFDPRLQGVLNQLSPSQLQHLLSSLASQTLNDTTQPGPSISSGTINPSATTTNGLLTQYQQPTSFDFSINPAHTNVYNPSGVPVVAPEGLIPFDAYDAGSPSDDQHAGSSNLGLVNNINSEQQLHDARMQRSWQAAEDIDKDVSALNTSIHSLIQTFGLDPSLLDDHSAIGSADAGVPPQQDDNMQGQTVPESNVNTSDFDFFNTFFNNMSAPQEGATGIPGMDGSSAVVDMDFNDLASTAFLDEAPTPVSDPTGSPAQSLRHVSPGLLELGTANDGDATSTSSGLNLASPVGGAKAASAVPDTGGQRLKRKSDVIMDFDSMNAASTDEQGATAKATSGASKPKKRKDK